MLFSTFIEYTISEVDQLISPQHLNGCGICLKIDSPDLLNDPSFYKKLGNLTNTEFCLLLDFTDLQWSDDVAMRRLWTNVIPVIFYPGYVSREPGRPLVLCSTQSNTAEQQLLNLHNELNSQGYESAETLFISENTGAARVFRIPGSTTIRDSYKALLQSILFSSDVLLIDSMQEDLQQVLKEMEEVESDLQSSHPRLYAQYESNNHLIAAYRASLFELKQHRARLDSHSTYWLSNIRDKEIKNIVGFYRNEYEILPLWFKRTGHLIKVLMGKRSFRSLYDRNVKKYKE